MRLDRRSVMIGGGAAGLAAALPGPALADGGTRMLNLYRGDKRIGSQELTVTREGADVRVAVSIDINVRILGLPAYRYQLQSAELWRKGSLLRLEGRTDDNGTAHSVSASRQGDALEIEGSGFTGVVTGNPATTTYWNPEFLKRDTWISTQDGKPLQVRAERVGTTRFPAEGGAAVQATQWSVSGDLDTLELFYDPSGEWVGNEFVARGQRARFILARRGADLTRLWTSA